MPRQSHVNRKSSAPEVIDPRWLLKALGISFAVALILALVTLSTYSWYRDHHPSHRQQQQPRNS